MTAPGGSFLTRLLSDTQAQAKVTLLLLQYYLPTYLPTTLHKSQPLIPFDRPRTKGEIPFLYLRVCIQLYIHDQQKKLLLLLVGWPAEPSKRRYLVNRDDVCNPPVRRERRDDWLMAQRKNKNTTAHGGYNISSSTRKAPR